MIAGITHKRQPGFRLVIFGHNLQLTNGTENHTGSNALVLLLVVKNDNQCVLGVAFLTCH